LRWLVYQGYIEHTTEGWLRREKKGQRNGKGRLTFTGQSCFLLTDKGTQFAQTFQFGAEEKSLESKSTISQQVSTAVLPMAPYWDATRGQLRWGHLVVKQFRQPAESQQTILAAFEEEGWPPRIDNPLPGRGKQEARERLHDAIIRLNRHQQASVIRFNRDGRGEGACWQRHPDSGTGAAPERHLT
jgi:hypothetical protein